MAQRSDLTAQTLLFADLSGFTALTEAHGDEQAADLLAGFCVAVRQLLAAHQAQEFKTIRDALMQRTADTAAAIRLGLCIVHDVGAGHGFPLVRVGMHTGPAVERGGDWFGATVNLAARVSAAAGDIMAQELGPCRRWATATRTTKLGAILVASTTSRTRCRAIALADVRWRSTILNGITRAPGGTDGRHGPRQGRGLHLDAGARQALSFAFKPMV